MTEFAIALVLTGMTLLLVCFLRRKSVMDRILIANAFGTKAMALIVLLAVAADNMMYLDIALVYALINFITTIALLKYFRQRSLGSE
jgi:multicomponent Na+:H+ antiporter subunit F